MRHDNEIEPDFGTEPPRADANAAAKVAVSQVADPSQDATTATTADNGGKPDRAKVVNPPTAAEMAEIHSLVAQLVAAAPVALNVADTSATSGLQPLTAVQAEIVDRAEDVAQVCESLGRRAAVAIALLSDGDDVRYLAAGAADRTVVFDIRKLEAWPEALRALLAGPLPKVVHNLEHAPRIMLRDAGVELSNVVDLYAAAVLADGYSLERDGEGYALGGLVARLLRRSLPPRNEGHEASRLAREVSALVGLHSRLKAATKDAKVERAWELENDVAVPVAAVEVAGFALDVERTQQLIKQADEKAHRAYDRLRPLLGDINLDSQDELRAALGRRCDFAFSSTSKLHLRRLSKDYPFLKDVLAYRDGMMHAQHARSWLDAAAGDGRVHATFDALAAATGRMGCSDPAVQSAPRDARACFVAAPDCSLVIADYAALELAVIADYTQDAEMLSCLRRDIDLHRRTAAFLVGNSVEHITDAQRTGAKAINFGFSYAMGVPTFLEHAEQNYGLLFDESFGRGARAKFFTLYPGVAAWHERVRAEGPRTLELRSSCGRLRRFAEFDFPAYVNTPIQSLAAAGFKRALVLMHPALKPTGARIVHLQHDEFVVEAPTDRVAEVATTIETAMIQAMSEFVTRVPVRVKVAIADSWAKA